MLTNTSLTPIVNQALRVRVVIRNSNTVDLYASVPAIYSYTVIDKVIANWRWNWNPAYIGKTADIPTAGATSDSGWVYPTQYLTHPGGTASQVVLGNGGLRDLHAERINGTNPYGNNITLSANKKIYSLASTASILFILPNGLYDGHEVIFINGMPTNPTNSNTVFVRVTRHISYGQNSLSVETSNRDIAINGCAILRLIWEGTKQAWIVP